jgi:hypothetical protein
MLHSKKHTKTPPEKPIKNYTTISHFALKDPLKDTDDESKAVDERTSNIHRPNVVASTASTARTIKVTFHTKRGDKDPFLLHVSFL